MLEKMCEFFENRLDGYDAHMLNNIASAREFYPFTAGCLPENAGCRILDLGCGTGLELEFFFALNPAAHVTGIDLSGAMLSALRDKFPHKDLTLIEGSYFETLLGAECYDAAVSVESLHHFTKTEKVSLYAKLHAALREEGFFILTDYFALSEAEELARFRELEALKAAQGISDGALYHFDTPLTVEHETQALLEAGFSAVEVLCNWGATYTLKAVR